ncbi:hypothetical protein [Leptospira sp. GIMC2001]|uniref:hypothetical protein n=1 Tax=Leptospira sp. GIMC2001 TaxID=1513297 RepID=UPI00234A4211|nr:hypothetical protein [Leptospira sp. GIMC2001]WCL50101.1 hypothetical protein O4O04_04590 [Leptospira sp. GIMC2001]
MKYFIALVLVFISISALFADGFKAGDRVEVLYPKDGKYYSGTILKIDKAGYLIHYDGYADSYNEVVTQERLKTISQIEGVTFLKSEKGKSIVVSGNLKTGSILEDLDWAASSSMACWPGSLRDFEFQGNQVYYWTDLPKKSTLVITVKPKNTKDRINLYAYSGFDPKYIVPNVPGAVSCEASYPQYVGSPDLSKPSEPQSVELRAVGNPYRVFIAVSGAKNVTEADYDLILEWK